VQEDAGFSYRSTRRVMSWHESDAVCWDLTARRAVVAPGFDLVKAGTKEAPTLQLVRTDPF
jgi:hypothetical protein